MGQVIIHAIAFVILTVLFLVGLALVEWCMNISQVTAKDDESLEYLSTLVTVELAAEIHRNKPNTAIRKTVARLLPRMNHPRVKAIMVGLARQAYPSGCLLMLRRELEEVVDGKVVFE